MYILSVNIGKVTPIQYAKESGLTGIYKLPAAEPVWVSALGLANDAIVDTENHGGYDQAVYVYGTDDYDWWSAELGLPLAPGTFGENLTISGLESALFAVGDRFVTTQVTLEVTSPRIPCVTLAARMGDPTFVKRYRHARRPGLYCRVIREGFIQAGEAVTLEPYPGEKVLAIEMFDNFYDQRPTEQYLRRLLSTPAHGKDRELMAEKLRAMQAKREAEQ